MDLLDVKTCTKCCETKPLTDFHKGKGYRDGVRARCKPCHNADVAAQTDRRLKRHRHYVSKFGITLEQYEAQFAAQRGLCAICARPERAKDRAGVVRPMAVDHDHEAGENRGLLCHACNAALGLLGDDAAIVQWALNYLTEARHVAW